MLMIGCDFHPGLQQIALLETETGRREDLRLTHDGDQVRRFYDAPPHPGRVGLEAGGDSPWVEEPLAEPPPTPGGRAPPPPPPAAPRQHKTPPRPPPPPPT